MSNIIQSISEFIEFLKAKQVKLVKAKTKRDSTSKDLEYLSTLIHLLQSAIADRKNEFEVKNKKLEAILKECLPFEDVEITNYVINTVASCLREYISARDKLTSPLLDIIRYCKTVPNFPLFCVLDATDPKVFDILNYIFKQTNETLALFLYGKKYEYIINAIIEADILSTGKLNVHLTATQKEIEGQFIDFVRATQSTEPKRFSEAGDFSCILTPELQERYERLRRYGRKPLSAPTSPNERVRVHVTPRLTKSNPTTPKKATEASTITMIAPTDPDVSAPAAVEKVIKKKPSQSRESTPIIPLLKLKQQAQAKKPSPEELDELKEKIDELAITDDGAKKKRKKRKHKKRQGL